MRSDVRNRRCHTFLFAEQLGNFLAAFANIAENLKIFYIIDGDKAVVFRPRFFELRTFPIIRKECVADGIAKRGFELIRNAPRGRRENFRLIYDFAPRFNVGNPVAGDNALHDRIRNRSGIVVVIVYAGD